MFLHYLALLKSWLLMANRAKLVVNGKQGCLEFESEGTSTRESRTGRG